MLSSSSSVLVITTAFGLSSCRISGARTRKYYFLNFAHKTKLIVKVPIAIETANYSGS